MIPEKTHSEGLPTMDKKDLNELAIEAAQLTPAARRAAMQVPMTKSLSNRGFGYIRFATAIGSGAAFQRAAWPRRRACG